MDTLTGELRYAARRLRKTPGISAVAVLALGLGIGANTAIFSVVKAVLLAPLPYSDPDRLFVIRETKLPQFTSFSVAPGNYLDWTEQQSVFQSMAAHLSGSYNLTGADMPEAVRGVRASASLFDVLGVSPAAGRAFTGAEDQYGREGVAIVSDGFGTRRFGGARAALGEHLTLDGRTHLIVGVMPKGFAFPDAETELWLPMAFTPRELENHGSHYMRVITRLAPSITSEQALTELEIIARRLEAAYPASNNGWSVRLDSLLDLTVGDTRPALLLLLAAVAFVLLIACGNVAGMLLARAATRQQEMAVRIALGASRGQIARQLLIESLLLATMGAVLGILLARWGVQLLPTLAPRLPRLDSVRIDGLTLAFTAAVAVVTSVVCGLLPAVHAARAEPLEALQDAGRGSSVGARRRRMRHGLVVGEIALALVLLVGAGLLIRSFSTLQHVDAGFTPAGALVARLELPEAQYADPETQWRFYDRLIAQLDELPGVEAVGATVALPFVRDYVLGLLIDGRPRPAPGDNPSTNYYAVSPGYFDAMGIRLVRGRLFTDRDRHGAPRVAVINETFARRHFPGDDPIGQRVHLSQGPKVFRQIVGIVADVQQYALDVEPPAQAYEPVAQQPFGRLMLVIRSSIEPASLSRAVRERVLALDPDLPVSQIETLEAVLDRWLVRRRAPMQMLAFFAGIALLLAGLGIYGALAYSVAQRTREVGIRVALGAREGDVLRLVVREGMTLAALGLVAGIVASLGITRLMGSLLFGVATTDPLTYVAVPCVLAGVALLASYVPARRATRVDPIVALRAE